MKSIDLTLEHYYEAVYDTDRDRALEVIEEAVSGGVDPEDIVFRVVIPAVERMVRELTVTRDSTLAQHYIAAKVAEEVTDAMVPRFARKPPSKGRVVLGTARGDFHGLGKKIVGGCLRAHMIEVTDLGLNVSPERLVDEAVERGAGVIGVSSMMVHTAQGDEGPRRVRRLLVERALEDRIKLVVGGAPYRFHSEMYREVGADAWAENGVEAAVVISNLLEET